MSLERVDGCEHCLNELISFVSNLKSSPTLEFAQPLWSLALGKGFHHGIWGSKIARRFKCPVCNHRLAFGDLVIEDEVRFKSGLAAEVAQVISEREIAECGRCNEDIVLFNQRMGYETHDIWDLLKYDYAVPKAIYAEVLENIRCRCGQHLDEWAPYVTEQEIDDWYGISPESVVHTFNLPRNAVISFIKHLFQYPMLAIAHPVGKTISEIIQQRNIDGFTILKQGTVLYRARIRNTVKNPESFGHEHLWAPSLGVPGQGRFNPPGIPVLYLADSPETALREVRFTRKSKRRVADVGVFVMVRDLPVWDLRETDLGEFVSVLSRGNTTTKPEYFFANFLAQCCTNSGVFGVLYGSVENPGGLNVALLNYEKERTVMVRRVRAGYGPVSTPKRPRKRKSRVKPTDSTFPF